MIHSAVSVTTTTQQILVCVSPFNTNAILSAVSGSHDQARPNPQLRLGQKGARAPEVVHSPPQISCTIHKLCTISAASSLFLHIHDMIELRKAGEYEQSSWNGLALGTAHSDEA